MSTKNLPLRGAGKILPAREPHPHPHTAPRTRTVKPHRSKCLPTSFPHNYFFDIFCSQNPCEVFLGPGLFFRPRRILIFWRLVNTFVLDVSRDAHVRFLINHTFSMDLSKNCSLFFLSMLESNVKYDSFIHRFSQPGKILSIKNLYEP